MKRCIITVIAVFAAVLSASAQAGPSPCYNKSDTLTNGGCQFTAHSSYAGKASSGTLQAFRNTSGSPFLSKTLLVVGPFDPLGEDTPKTLLDDYLSDHRFQEKLRSKGYDILVLHMGTKTSDYIQRNALVVKDTITKLREWRNNQDSIVIMGMSLGGVYARYALATMEREGIEHDVRTYISFDAPHKGANIPEGAQHIPDFYKAAITAAKEEAKEAGDIVNSLGLISGIIGFGLTNWADNTITDPLEDELGEQARQIGAISEAMVNSVAAQQLLINHRSPGDSSHEIMNFIANPYVRQTVWRSAELGNVLPKFELNTDDMTVTITTEDNVYKYPINIFTVPVIKEIWDTAVAKAEDKIHAVSQPLIEKFTRELQNSGIYNDGSHLHRYQWLLELNQLGYPEQTRNIALANGSVRGWRQWGFTGDKYIDHDQTIEKVTTILRPRVTQPGIEAFYGKMRGPENIAGIWGERTTYHEVTVRARKTAVAIDDAPGGRNNSFGELAKKINATDDDMNMRVLINGHNFIPTKSALDLPMNHLHDAIEADNRDRIAALSPFDKVYTSFYNDWHLSLNYNWIDELIEDIEARHDIAWLVPVLTL